MPGTEVSLGRMVYGSYRFVEVRAQTKRPSVMFPKPDGWNNGFSWDEVGNIVDDVCLRRRNSKYARRDHFSSFKIHPPL